MKDNTKNFDITKPHADSWSMWRNDRPKGVGASKVAEGGKPIKKEASFKSMLTN
jgi:hypothetical protein